MMIISNKSHLSPTIYCRLLSKFMKQIHPASSLCWLVHLVGLSSSWPQIHHSLFGHPANVTSSCLSGKKIWKKKKENANEILSINKFSPQNVIDENALKIIMKLFKFFFSIEHNENLPSVKILFFLFS